MQKLSVMRVKGDGGERGRGMRFMSKERVQFALKTTDKCSNRWQGSGEREREREGEIEG